MFAGMRACEPRLASTYAPAVMMTTSSISPSSVLRRRVIDQPRVVDEVDGRGVEAVVEVPVCCCCFSMRLRT